MIDKGTTELSYPLARTRQQVAMQPTENHRFLKSDHINFWINLQKTIYVRLRYKIDRHIEPLVSVYEEICVQLSALTTTKLLVINLVVTCSKECVTHLDYQSKVIIFGSILTNFELSSIFGGSWGSIEYWLDLNSYMY